MVEKEKQIERYKQKNIQLEEKLSNFKKYVDECKKKEKSSSLFDDIPDTQQLNNLKDEIKILEVGISINFLNPFFFFNFNLIVVINK